MIFGHSSDCFRQRGYFYVAFVQMDYVSRITVGLLRKIRIVMEHSVCQLYELIESVDVLIGGSHTWRERRWDAERSLLLAAAERRRSVLALLSCSEFSESNRGGTVSQFIKRHLAPERLRVMMLCLNKRGLAILKIMFLWLHRLTGLMNGCSAEYT